MDFKKVILYVEEHKGEHFKKLLAKHKQKRAERNKVKKDV